MPSDYQLDVYNFLRTAMWRPVQGSTNGSSWVELLARFTQLGGQVFPKLEDDIFAKKPSLAKLLTSFTNTTCAITIDKVVNTSFILKVKDLAMNKCPEVQEYTVGVRATIVDPKSGQLLKSAFSRAGEIREHLCFKPTNRERKGG